MIGAGSWGTTVAALTSTNASTVLWARDPGLAERLNRDHCNADYLPDIELPDALEATESLDAACAGADVVVMGVPSHGFRTVLVDARSSIANDAAVISLSKGLEQGTVLRMTQVIAEVLPDHRPDRIGVLSGPNLAREVASGQPTATVVALGDAELAQALQALFMTGTFRVYTNPDVVGCEIAGALKNVIAIAAGIAHGLGYGDNTKAALDHPRVGRAGPARHGARRRPVDVLRARGDGRPGGHVHEREEPEPDRRRRARPGTRAR